MADLKKFEGALDQMIKLLTNMKESLEEDSSTQPSKSEPPVQAAVPTADEFDNFDQLKQALTSEKWPEAVNPNLICDPNSTADKKERGRGVIELMIEEELKGLKVLDFGCGEGHCINTSTEYGTALSAGYDIKENNTWADFEQKDNLLMTTSWEQIKNSGPYNVIIIFDVIDHIKGQTGAQALNQVKDVLADNGRIYMRCHPFVSRHATHLYHELNKAFVHLVFTEQELSDLVPESQHAEENTGVTFPLRTYGEYIEAAGLTIINRRDITEKVEPFFKIPKIAERIMKNTGINDRFPEFQMSLQFIDYVLGK